MPLSTQEYWWVLVNCQGSLMKCPGGWGGAAALDWHPIWGGGAVLLVPSCHGSRDESHLERLLGLSADILTPLMMTSAHDYLGCWIRGPFQQ